MNSPLTLVSHVLCPYVQRAAIVLDEKGIPFERRNVDLAHKPDWFLACSPLGKTPVLLVGKDAIFESTVICEYLDETLEPRLHPSDPLQRARHRAWMEFGSSLLSTIGAFYNAGTEEALQAQAAQIKAKLALLEAELGTGPWFRGAHFSVVDAVFGPVFRYFDVLDQLGDFRFWEHTPKAAAWRAALAARPSVHRAVRPDYDALLRTFIRQRSSALSQRVDRAA